MALSHWSPFLDPFGEWDKMFDEFRKTMPGGFTPAMDIYENDKTIVVETELPGIDPKNVEVSVEHDVLTIQGKTEKKTEVDEKNYYRKEIHSGSFYRSVALPAHVDGNKAKADFEDGVLKVTVPKKAANKPTKIAVTIKKKTKKKN